jgi:magnesium transporter
MIRSLYFDSPTHYRENLSLSEISTILQAKTGLLWISLEQAQETEQNVILRDVFNFHPLTIEDCQSQGYQVPKLDDFGAYIFIIAHAISIDEHIDNSTPLELNIFLGDNFVVTNFNGSRMPPVSAIWERMKIDDRLVHNGADFLCHAILDYLVDEYMPVLDHMDDDLENLEDKVLARPAPDILSKVLDQKHNIMYLRRIITPQREVINRLSRDDFSMIDRQSKIYFRDIYDHLVRIQELTESLRDIVSGILDIYLNSTSLRLNEIMKALTVVSTIFLPLSFVAGVYGMNFHYMPELTWKFGYLFIWIVFVAIFAGMLIFFKRRNWF